MKYSKDLLIFQSVLFSLYSIYSIYKQNKKIKTLENDIETVLKTHLGYMEVCEVQQEAIKDLYDMIEGIACSIPFTSKHAWQNRMLQRKLQRELDKHLDVEEHEKYHEEQMIKKIHEDQKKERDELNRKRRTDVQIKRVVEYKEDIQHTKFYDDETVEASV